jgi:hypothetical protein
MNFLSVRWRNLKNQNWFNEILLGLVVFLVPFFTFLSPSNLKQLSTHLLLEIIISLLFIFIILYVFYHYTSIVISKLLGKKINGLFCLYCFGFYLLFLSLPARNLLYNPDYPKNGMGILATAILLVFWLAIVCLAIKFNQFVVRLILIYSILILTTSIIPMLGYFYGELSREQKIHQVEEYQAKKNEKNNPSNQNVYYIILDAMLSVEAAQQMAIIDDANVVKKIEKLGLRYIDKSLSTYDKTFLTLTSIFYADYHYREGDERYTNELIFFPFIMDEKDLNVPLISYLNQVSSTLYWIGNYMLPCFESLHYNCIYTSKIIEKISSLMTFFKTTPFRAIFRKIGAHSSQDAIGRFLTIIQRKGLPKKPFFAFIHQLAPHPPFSFTKTCGFAKVEKKGGKGIEGGYSDSYYCALQKIKEFMKTINKLDPDAIVVIQADHGWTFDDKINFTQGGKIFNAVKAPNSCFDKYGEPKTNVNSIRFVLNCAYGFDMPYRKDIHYRGFHFDELPQKGAVVEESVY